jgi:uncharacterized protein (TIGR02246 family)
VTNAMTDTSTAEALMRMFTDRVHAGDLEGLVALYEPSAVFEPQPGVVVRGRDAIRRALAELLALRPTMVANTLQILQADDVALVVNEWSMTGTGPHGSEVHRGGRSAGVVRRQSDGSWLVDVDKPRPTTRSTISSSGPKTATHTPSSACWSRFSTTSTGVPCA